MPARHSFFATTAKGFEELLATELRQLGADKVEVAVAGASFSGGLEVGYRVCLWSRVASRVLLPLVSFRAETPEQLYAGVRRVGWTEHLGPRDTLAVDCSVSQSRLNHSHYAALKTKDAIVDQLRERAGSRPSIDVANPDLRINVYVNRDRAVVSIDLSGDSLHRRGYRERGLAAPLKENLAAGLLLLAEWPQLADLGAPLLDPMCGSGTIVIEAALIAADIAPGLGRTRFGFSRWRAHEADVWRRLLAEAKARVIRDPKKLPVIRGSDISAAAVNSAIANAERAGVRDRIQLERRSFAEAGPPLGSDPGILLMNPPYGERLGDVEKLAPLYAEVGDVLRRRFTGWTGYVITGNPALAKHIGLRPARRFVVFNGAIECRLLRFPISATGVQTGSGPRWRKPPPQNVPPVPDDL